MIVRSGSVIEGVSAVRVVQAALMCPIHRHLKCTRGSVVRLARFLQLSSEAAFSDTYLLGPEPVILAHCGNSVQPHRRNVNSLSLRWCFTQSSRTCGVI